VSPYSGALSSFYIRKELVLALAVFCIHIFAPVLIRGVVVSTCTSYSLGSGVEFHPRCLFPESSLFYLRIVSRCLVSIFIRTTSASCPP
jgi:hypothetical protein